jgi:hypothetical protein
MKLFKYREESFNFYCICLFKNQFPIKELDYVIPEWVPAGAKDLIERILQENVNKRPSLNQLWFHPWIQESGYMLDPYRHQIKLAQKEIRAQSMEYDFYGEVPRSVKPIKRPSMIVGYMDSSQSPAKDIITVVAAKSSMLESCSSVRYIFTIQKPPPYK